MTKKQEAIERLKRIDVKFFISGMNEVSNYIIDEADKVNNAIETVLNMLKENSAEIEQKNTELAEKNAEIERLNRQIDLMAEEIEKGDIEFTEYCNFKIVCDRNCKECIVKYFERKATNNG